MKHAMINGQTESGKTRLAHHISHGFVDSQFHVIVYDPIQDPNWRMDQDFVHVHSDIDRFNQQAKRATCCGLFVDEAGEILNDTNRGRQFHWLMTRARHQGHVTHLISQRSNQIAKTARDQASRLFLFNSSLSDSKLHADEWNCPQLRGTNQLDRGEFFSVDRFGPVRLCRIDFESLKVTVVRSIKRG